MVKKHTFCVYVLVGLTLFAFGCMAPRSVVSLDELLQTGVQSEQTIFALKGEILSNHNEEPFKVLDFRMIGNQMISSELVLHLLVYKRTVAYNLPTNALILVERKENGTLEVLGRDGRRSIVEDSLANIAKLTERLKNGQILPPRRLRLPASSAIAIANKELNIENVSRFKTVATRVAFGWEISYEPRGELRTVGDEVSVVVGDDKAVIAVHRGY